MKKVRAKGTKGQHAGNLATKPAPGTSVYIGIDVSRSKWAFNVRWGGQERRQYSTPYGIEHVQAVVQEYGGCELHVTYESCGFGYEIAWYLQKRGIDVVVVPPSTVERPRGSQVKTDRLDARKLCGKLEKGDLKRAYIPTRCEHERRQLSRTYTQLLKDRQRQQTRVRSLMQQHGVIGPPPKAGWAAYHRWLCTQKLPEPVALSVEQLLGLRAGADKRITRMSTALLQLAEDPAYCSVVKALKSQKGVGPFTAIRLVLEIGDITRFHSAEAFVHYLGLTPSEYTSSETEHRGHLLKCGPGFVRAWLVECAWSSIRGKKPDPRLYVRFQRVSARAGKKRAIVAVARQMARKLRALWLEALAPTAQAA